MATANLKVTGMTCGHCVMAVTKALENLPGVRAAKVALDDGRATVDYDDSQTSTEAMKAAVADEGYSAEEQT